MDRDALERLAALESEVRTLRAGVLQARRVRIGDGIDGVADLVFQAAMVGSEGDGTDESTDPEDVLPFMRWDAVAGKFYISADGVTLSIIAGSETSFVQNVTFTPATDYHGTVFGTGFYDLNQDSMIVPLARAGAICRPGTDFTYDAATGQITLIGRFAGGAWPAAATLPADPARDFYLAFARREA